MHLIHVAWNILLGASPDSIGRNVSVVDCILTALVLSVAIAAPKLGDRWWTTLERFFSRLARQRVRVWLGMGLTVLAVRAAFLPVWPIPRPEIHDEFSYLLGADTFASGRLTNPQHPLWPFFETIHILQKPSYASKYQPGQALAMAVGQRLFGHPWFGIWLSCGVMSAALCWCLQGWLPPGWALLGGAIAALRLGLFSYWIDSYWGGAVAAIGGALVLGAYPRLVRQRKFGYVWALGAGIVVLVISRPFEGGLLSLPILAAIALWSWKRATEQGWAPIIQRLALPLAGVLTITGIALAYYDWRITGKLTRLPYVEHDLQYSVAPPLYVLPLRPAPVYGHPDLQRWHQGHVDAAKIATIQHDKEADFDRFHNQGIDLMLYYRDRSWQGIKGRLLSFNGFAHQWFGMALLLAACMLPWVVRDRRVRLALVSFTLVIIGVSLDLASFGHYAAPALAAGFVCMMQCLRHLRQCKLGQRPTGLFLSRALPAVSILGLLGAEVAVRPYRLGDFVKENPNHLIRSEILQKLNNLPGKQLVIARYPPNYDYSRFEYIFNRADIDASQVVWARDRGDVDNPKLLDYFRDRSVWLLDASADPPKLIPYRPAETPSTPGVKSQW
jgi:hypothetical protein